MAQSKLRLWYDSPAPADGDEVRNDRDRASLKNDGWEKWSLPIGCGYFGANIFGRTDTERVQITENSLVSPRRKTDDGQFGGLANFGELFLDFGHSDIGAYSRYLDLDEAISGVSYECNGVRFEREYFASYLERALVISLTASVPGSLTFVMRPELPFKGAERDGGYTAVDGCTVTVGCTYGEYLVQNEAIYKLHTDGGKIIAQDAAIKIENANSAYITAVFGTNYRLESRVFTVNEPAKKLEGNPHPHEKLCKIIAEAEKYSYTELRERHVDDYRSLFARVSLDIDAPQSPLTTDRLLESYRNDTEERYLETLYFQYGRYLLISSSRPGTLPPNLQGTWNRYDGPPWGSGYWHNINIQMNYWPAFVTNIAETFEPYVDFCRAYMDKAETYADNYIRTLYPERVSSEKGGNGWAIGTAAWPYYISSPSTASHSGPGEGAFTTQLFWDMYAYSPDIERLRTDIYPPLKSMARFLEKTLIEKDDGTWLVQYSASPEQYNDGHYYRTEGCAFDQSMVWECFTETLAAADILGDNDDLIQSIREKLPHLDPVSIGADGQIKEYREEVHYGDIGEYHHRHISHLVGVYPGTLVTPNTPKLLEAAEKSLEFRGDKSTGWAMAHRLNTWARIRNGKRAHMLYRQLLSSGTLPNLWDTHPPFQIDGNLGGTSGVAEMLIQSHTGRIDILPCLPNEWKRGSFNGLRARGGFTVDASWDDGRLKNAVIQSFFGNSVRLGFDCAVSCCGKEIPLTRKDGDVIFETNVGGVYEITVK